MLLIYDGECPFCSRYVRLMRIREAVGELKLVDAREGGQIVEDVRQRGYVIDQGMVLILNGRYYHGEASLHMLALLSTKQGWFNRINYWLFSRQWLSKIAYPAMKAGRNAVLKLMGRKKLGY